MDLEQEIIIPEENRKIAERVISGEKVPCPECGSLLINQGKKYPCVYCSTDEKHFRIYFTNNMELVVGYPIENIKGYRKLKFGDVNIIITLQTGEEIFVPYIDDFDVYINHEIVYLPDKNDKTVKKVIKFDDMLSIRRAE
ncbi:MAG TPA: hypothetical protein VF941_23000 [Clostridia bacterium]